MATKYLRKGYREHALGEEAHRDFSRPVLRMTARQRLLLIYLGLGAFAIVLGFSELVLPGIQFQGQPVVQGHGVVFDKKMVGAAGTSRRCRVGIALAQQDGAPLRARYTVSDPVQWKRLSGGDIVAVAYQVGRWGKTVRVLNVQPLAPDELLP